MESELNQLNLQYVIKTENASNATF